MNLLSRIDSPVTGFLLLHQALWGCPVCGDEHTALGRRVLTVTGLLDSWVQANICIFKIFCPCPLHDQPSTTHVPLVISSSPGHPVLLEPEDLSLTRQEVQAPSPALNTLTHCVAFGKTLIPLFLAFPSVYTIFCRSTSARSDEITSAGSFRV